MEVDHEYDASSGSDTQQQQESEDLVYEPQPFITVAQNPVVQELEKMMESHDEEKNGPQVINLKVVHGMFRRMDEAFRKEIQELKNQFRQKSVAETSSPHCTAEIDDLTKQTRRLTVKTKAISSAIQNAWEDRVQLQERVEHLENAAFKKMIVINGLEVFGKKNEKIQQIEKLYTTRNQS